VSLGRPCRRAPALPLPPRAWRAHAEACPGRARGAGKDLTLLPRQRRLAEQPRLTGGKGCPGGLPALVVLVEVRLRLVCLAALVSPR